VKERLQLEKDLQEINARNQDVPKEIENKKAALSTARTRILDEILFQAMADITFFFDAVGTWPEIQKVFDDDIREILGVKRTNPKETPYGFMFTMLIAGILSVQFKTGKDFRLRLNELLHYIIQSKVAAYQSDIFKSAATQGSIGQDYNRVLGWAEMLAFAMDKGDEYEIPPVVHINRSTGPTKPDKQLIKNYEVKYLKDVKRNSPNRTFDYDSKLGQIK
jgi:hypothetical protein